MKKISRFAKRVVKVFGGGKRGEWETPPALFKLLDDEFHFTLDVCASPINAKCPRFFTKERNGLKQSWNGEVCWLNPPYSEIPKWLEKTWMETREKGTIVVALLPVNTDTRWFKKYCTSAEIRFLRRRVSFLDVNKKPRKGNPRASMIVIFRSDIEPKMFSWEAKWK